jgi:hypothetical protein
MVDKSKAREPSQNIEDRRDEFGELQHLLMATGSLPPDETNPDKVQRENLNLAPGQYLDSDVPIPPITYLGVEAGIPDLMAMQAALHTGHDLDPWLYTQMDYAHKHGIGLPPPRQDLESLGEAAPAEISYKNATKKRAR